MTPDEVEARLYADERRTLKRAEMMLRFRKYQLSQTASDHYLTLKRADMESTLDLFDQVLAIAKSYHTGAEDLVG